MSTLTITRGLPGSGKTTWAKAQEGSVRVNRDELRLMLHGRVVGEHWAEAQVTAAQHGAVRALLLAGADVICDDTNLKAKSVKALAEIAVECGADVVVKDFLSVSVEECIERDSGRPEAQRVGEEVIRSKYARYVAGRRAEIELPRRVEPQVYVPPTDRPYAILVDIDGTLALMGSRNPYDASRVHLDRPNEPVIRAVRAMQEAGNTIVYCSGRTEECREATLEWLEKHVGVPHAGLHMRAGGDQRKDSVVKREIFDREVRGQWHVTGVFDDRNQVVRMWRELGLTVFQVAEGDF